MKMFNNFKFIHLQKFFVALLESYESLLESMNSFTTL